MRAALSGYPRKGVAAAAAAVLAAGSYLSSALFPR